MKTATHPHPARVHPLAPPPTPDAERQELREARSALKAAKDELARVKARLREAETALSQAEAQRDQAHAALQVLRQPGALHRSEPQSHLAQLLERYIGRNLLEYLPVLFAELPGEPGLPQGLVRLPAIKIRLELCTLRPQELGTQGLPQAEVLRWMQGLFGERLGVPVVLLLQTKAEGCTTELYNHSVLCFEQGEGGAPKMAEAALYGPKDAEKDREAALARVSDDHGSE